MPPLQNALLTSSSSSGARAVISKIPIPEPADDQVIIKTVSFALNPTDWKNIDRNNTPGNITGCDASGVVYKIGKNITRLKVGDVVSSYNIGNTNTTRGAFAEFIIGKESTTIKYYRDLKPSLEPGVYRSGVVDSYAGAASLTLGLSTVVYAFVGDMNISEQDRGSTILIWGGATATGILAIQVAKKSFGLNVITTASKKHHDYLKCIGADHVFDYNEDDVLEKIKATAKGNIRYAFDTVSSPETWQMTYESTTGSPKVTLDNLLFRTESDLKIDDREGEVIFSPVTLATVAQGEPIQYNGQIWTAEPSAFARYLDFWFKRLPIVLKELYHSRLRVLEPGLESANNGWDILKGGVSGEKIVFHK